MYRKFQVQYLSVCGFFQLLLVSNVGIHMDETQEVEA